VAPIETTDCCFGYLYSDDFLLIAFNSSVVKFGIFLNFSREKRKMKESNDLQVVRYLKLVSGGSLYHFLIERDIAFMNGNTTTSRSIQFNPYSPSCESSRTTKMPTGVKIFWWRRKKNNKKKIGIKHTVEWWECLYL
jgi:hypothetical protein